MIEIGLRLWEMETVKKYLLVVLKERCVVVHPVKFNASKLFSCFLVEYKLFFCLQDAKKTEDTEYNNSFAKLKVEEDSPIILASKAKMKEKTRDRKRETTRSTAPKRPQMGTE